MAVATTLIGLLVAVSIILILCVIGYFNETVPAIEVVAWIGGGAVFAAVLLRLLAGWFGGRGTGSSKPRGGGPAAAGLARLRRGEMEAAESLLRACLERHANDVGALRGLAEIAYRRGDAEGFVQLASRLLAQRDALRRAERVALCHRQADVCLAGLRDRERAVEALARIELDYPGTTDAMHARRRIERVLTQANGTEPETD